MMCSVITISRVQYVCDCWSCRATSCPSCADVLSVWHSMADEF